MKIFWDMGKGKRNIFRVLIFVASMMAFVPLSAQWEVIHESGEGSGHFDVHFLNNDTGFVTGIDIESSYSFILRTRDGGQNWDSLFFENHRFRDIYFPSADTGYISCFYQNTVSVMRTINNGDSWQRIADNLETANSVPYAISFFDNNVGIISLAGLVAKTTNAGVSWEAIEDSPYYGYRDNDIQNGYFISMGSALLAWSTDYGETFQVDTLEDYGSHDNLTVRDHRFLSSSLGSQGQSWGYPQFSFGILTIGDVEAEEYNVMHFPERNRMHGVSWPSENVMYAISRSNVSEGDNPKFFIKSIDGGQTWHLQETIDPFYYGTQELFCPSDSVCYAVGGNLGKIYKTTNGGGPLGDPVTQIPLSIEDLSKPQIAFELYPNPAQNQITIQCEEQIVRVDVMDVSGRVLQSAGVLPKNGVIDIGELPSGIYLVRIETDGGGFGVRKLVME
jgi:photosystem II stability/assembly factor-like uncharacterized protein